MTDKPAIAVRDVVKTFTVNSSGARSLKTALLWWRRKKLERFDVLRGVSFDVQKGECVAVIGRNGAGKSTLLALIAKIYKPNAGSIEINGRVAPLLELGAGFHPDLSGIENIIFNGVVLGLTRTEVMKRIPDIVAFSEIGEKVYSPVRTFSSGMLSRLGFSIAVHVDADILLVDEVLSVGDYAFQKKAEARISEFRASGGTILLVSHQEDAIRKIADRCVWIQHGEVHRVGTPLEVLPDYLATSESDLQGGLKGPVRIGRS